MEKDFHKFLQHYADLEAKVDYLFEALIYKGLSKEQIDEIKAELRSRGAQHRVVVAKQYREVFASETVEELQKLATNYQNKTK